MTAVFPSVFLLLSLLSPIERGVKRREGRKITQYEGRWQAWLKPKTEPSRTTTE